MNIKKIILEEIRRSIFEGVEHMENLYKAWANKKSGNPEAAMKIMDDVISNRRSLSKKDFAKYNSYEELLKDLNQIKKAKAPDDVTKFYEDKDLLVVAANTWEASCKYGAGSKWCTTAKDTSSYWDRHNTTGTEFFWIFKNKPQDDSNHKFSYHIKAGGGTDWCNAINNCRTNLTETSYPKQHPNYDEIIQKLMEYHNSREMTASPEQIGRINYNYINDWLTNNGYDFITTFEDLINFKSFIESHSDFIINNEVMDGLFDSPGFDLEELLHLGMDEKELYDMLLQDLNNSPFNDYHIDRDMLLRELTYTVKLILGQKYNINPDLPIGEEIERVFGRPLEISDVLTEEIVDEYEEEFNEILDEVVGFEMSNHYYKEAELFIGDYLEEYKRKNNLD